MDTIIIYTNETCPYCKSIKEELTKANIEFKERITSEWPAKWQEINNLTNMPTVPTIEYHDEYFIPGRDFGNPQQLINILNIFEKIEFEDKPTSDFREEFQDAVDLTGINVTPIVKYEGQYFVPG